MAVIYVIRHGKTRLNVDSVIIGWKNVSLTNEGIKSARRMSLILKDKKIRAIVTSDLKRAMETARIIGKQLKIADIRVIPELKEINYGKLEGRKKSEIRRTIPEYHTNVDFRNPGGESLKDLEKRVVKVIKILCAKDKIPLLVTHAGCMRVIYSYFRKQPLKKNILMKIGHETIFRCSKKGSKRMLRIIHE